MNVVNRLIVVLGVVVLIAFAAMVIVLAWAYSGETIQALRNFATFWGDRETNGTRVIITLIAGFVILVGLAFLVLELAPRAEKAVVVRDVETGAAVLSTAAVARRLEQIVTSLPEVEAVRAKVVSRKKAVEVNLQVMVDPESDLSAIASEVARVTQEAVTQQMSVAMAGGPRLRLYYSARSTSVPPPPSRAAEPQEGKRARKVRVVPGAGEGEAAPSPAGPQASTEEVPPESKKNEGEQ
jgi:hypothetical protein